jgi:hypothetical protein
VNLRLSGLECLVGPGPLPSGTGPEPYARARRRFVPPETTALGLWEAGIAGALAVSPLARPPAPVMAAAAIASVAVIASQRTWELMLLAAAAATAVALTRLRDALPGAAALLAAVAILAATDRTAGSDPRPPRSSTHANTSCASDQSADHEHAPSHRDRR